MSSAYLRLLILSYKKKHICTSSNEVDELETYYTECSKSERETKTLYAAAAAKSLQLCPEVNGQILRKVQASKTEPGRNRNYEQPNYRH